MYPEVLKELQLSPEGDIRKPRTEVLGRLGLLWTEPAFSRRHRHSEGGSPSGFIGYSYSEVALAPAGPKSRLDPVFSDPAGGSPRSGARSNVPGSYLKFSVTTLSSG